MNATIPLEKNIAGEIAIASEPACVIKKWREIFQMSQGELAKEMGVSPSVVSDYESGRRQSPGTHFIKNLVESLVKNDAKRGGETIKRFTIEKKPDAILSIRDFSSPAPAARIVDVVDGQTVGRSKTRDVVIKGYTVIDSLKAIVELSEDALRDIYGSTTERALIFTKVHSGRSPLIAVKVTKPKPNMIILHGLKPNKVDKLAVKIADSEDIPLVVSTIKNEGKLLESLDRIR
jgi:putative transcriptional regulator